VVNRHLDRDVEAEIEVQGGAFQGGFEVQVVTGPDIKAENDFGRTAVKAEKSSATASGSRLRHRFPAHSYTMLKGALA
jgi:alpha-N-arabinofuranosidase